MYIFIHAFIQWCMLIIDSLIDSYVWEINKKNVCELHEWIIIESIEESMDKQKISIDEKMSTSVKE